MSFKMWPRLPLSIAEKILEDYSELSLQELANVWSTQHRDAAVAETGGAAVSENDVNELRTRILEVAESLGFDGTSSATEQQAKQFDQRAPAVLYEIIGNNANDLAAPETWNFISLVVLPDIAIWRFPNRANARLLGGDRNGLRNVFSRLWVRAHFLDDDLLRGADPLSEDELVGLTERSTFLRYPRFLRIYSRKLLAWANQTSGARRDAFRIANVHMMRRLAFLNPNSIPNETIEDFVDDVLESIDLDGIPTPTEVEDQQPAEDDQVEEQIEDRFVPWAVASQPQLFSGLIAVVSELGPIIAEHAYREYIKQSGGAKLTKPASQAFNRACAKAVRAGELKQLNDNLSGQRAKTLHMPGAPSVVVRPETSRTIDEIPLSELLSAADSLGLEISRDQTDWQKELLTEFGLQKLTERAKGRLASLTTYKFEI